ncbi:MAG: amidohydrolase family protein [Desulfohalobiaceae bacterium]|nr:amidohydrolase family protein [Desulfohalobiaceae bacterium]
MSDNSIQALRAGKIMTMAPDRPLLTDGVLLAADGIIHEIAAYREIKKEYLGPIQDLGPGIMAPGLINAHTHLELSHLKGRTVTGLGFEDWVQSLIRLPLKGIDARTLARVRADLSAGGTACVGDISGHSPSLMHDFLSASGLFFHLFLEQIGFREKALHPLPGKQNRLRSSPSGHALYSTHHRTLQLIKGWCREQGHPFAVHLAEHPGEVELLTTGQGRLAGILKKGLLPESFTPPGLTPVTFADRLGLLDPGTLAVHVVYASPEEIELLARRGAAVCLCPRSNALIGVGRAPAEKLLAAGIDVCLGTDSLCSNTDLDLFAEAAFFARDLHLDLGLEQLLALITRNPARILNMDKEIGTLERGKRALFSLVPEELSSEQ